MNIEKYINDKKDLHKKILDYLNSENDLEEHFQNFIDKLNEDRNLLESKYELQSILYMILKLSDYHQRNTAFFTKIEKIMLYMKEKIKQTYSNQEIYDFFQNNKRILLILFQNEFIKLDKSFVSKILTSKSKNPEYFYYFFNVFKSFMNKNKREQIEKKIKELNQDIFDNFDQKVQLGENDNYICQLIRDDSIDEFISFVNQKSIFHSSKIDQSIFETNTYLLKNKPNLIEYSAFYGSVQVFKYLYMNGAELSPSLWLYSIHGKNPEIIQILVDNQVQPSDNTFSECFNESVKCNDIEISEYILNNFINNKTEKDLIRNSNSIKYSNYYYFPSDLNDPLIFYELCQYNYYEIVKYVLNNFELDVNKLIIRIIF